MTCVIESGAMLAICGALYKKGALQAKSRDASRHNLPRRTIFSNDSLPPPADTRMAEGGTILEDRPTFSTLPMMNADTLPAFVYIVRCADGTLYTGWTFDVARRVAEHNAGRGARYTRQRGPVALVYSEAHPDRASAMRREEEIKRRGRVYKDRLLRAAEDGH
jgi:putative endonuclease